MNCGSLEPELRGLVEQPGLGGQWAPRASCLILETALQQAHPPQTDGHRTGHSHRPGRLSNRAHRWSWALGPAPGRREGRESQLGRTRSLRPHSHMQEAGLGRGEGAGAWTQGWGRVGPCDASRKGASQAQNRRERGRRGCRAAALKPNQSRCGAPGRPPHCRLTLDVQRCSNRRCY